MVFNTIQFRKETRSAIESLAPFAFNAANTRFVAAKQNLIDEFENHPVTREIEEGSQDPEATNISNTLDGRGNLFSFIGFFEGDDPTEIVKEMLEASTRLERRPSITYRGSFANFNFIVRMPNLSDLESETPMPWENGRSWLTAIERGISGLSYYLYWKHYLPQSRSGGGVQVNNKLRNLTYRPVSYISKILQNFRKRFR